MKKIEKISQLVHGVEAKLYDIKGKLFHCPLHKAWYVLSNSAGLDGSAPGNWSEVQELEEVQFSFWICNDTDDNISYEVLMDGKLHSFNPQPGDILHILSEEDTLSINNAKDLSGGGGYFGHTYKVLRLDSANLLCGEIIDASGHVINSSWLLHTRDFYEFHNINPPVTQYIPSPSTPGPGEKEPARAACRFNEGMTVNILNEKMLYQNYGTRSLKLGGDFACGTKVKINSIDHFNNDVNCYVLSVNVPLPDGSYHKNFLLAETDTYEYHKLSVPTETITIAGMDIATGTNNIHIGTYSAIGTGLTLKDVSAYMYDTSGSMGIDMSRDKPRHLEGKCSTLRPTSSYEVDGDSVPRNKRLDSMILLNL